MDEIIRHVFGTLTFNRNKQIPETWKQTTTTYNRFIQKWRRLDNKEIQYIRSIESHKDGYPHIHTIIQYPSACIRIRNSKYFDRTVYQNWKTRWPFGYSDYTKPTRHVQGTLAYLLKYITKTSTKKTIWKKILPKQTITGTGAKSATEPIKLYGIKLVTWSRNFDWEPFKIEYPQYSDDCLDC